MMRKKLRRRLLISILLAIFGLVTSLSLPALSVGEQNALDLAQQARYYYNSGNLERAIKLWDQSAVAYEEIDDEEGVTKSLINQSQALQDLGFYPRACQSLIWALFDDKNADCRELTLGRRFFPTREETQSLSDTIDGFIKDFEEQERQGTLFLTQAIGLRGFGNVLRGLEQLEMSKKVLILSLNVAKQWQSPKDESAAYLELGNTQKAIAKRNLNRKEYKEISDLIVYTNERELVEKALEFYKPAFETYQQVAAVEFAPAIVKTEAQVNYLNSLLELKEWWEEQIKKRMFSWDNSDYLQYQKFGEPDYRKELERAKTFQTLLDYEFNQQVGNWSQLILQSYRNLTLDRSTLYPQISIAKSLMRANKNLATNEISPSTIEEILNVALTQAQTLEDRRAEAYALGYLGELYEEEALNNFNLTPSQKEALFANATDNIVKAVWLAQSDGINSLPSEVTYLWKSRLGGLYEEREKLFVGQPERQNELRKQAIAAYASAVNTVEIIRQDLITNSREVRLDFQQDVAPVYRELIDLLLGSNLTEEELQKLTVILNPNQAKKDDKVKSPIELARQIIELLQIAELESFFTDPCLPSPEEFVLEKFDKQAAVIYPIILKDRLEVILLLPNKTVKVEKKGTNFTATLNKLYDNLSNEDLIFSSIRIAPETNEPEILATNQLLLQPLLERVYDWLIEPLEGELEANDIKTLAFVLTDPFQRIPMAALYNNGEYLLEKYNIALVPSLQLLNPQPSREKLKVLAAGLSQIPVQENQKNWDPLLYVENEITTIENIVAGTNKDLPIGNSGDSYDPVNTPRLECPESQSQNSSSSRENANNSPVKQLLNCDFNSRELQKQIGSESSFSVVHLATHGQFSSDPEETFILTSEGEINVPKFREIFDRYSDDPDNSNFKGIELLVLSACKTATGDERAVLGLAGLATRSGARSTVATLWSVTEASSPIFVERFYQELINGANKAEALRLAQLELLKNPEYSHPVYWAPYVLVNDWRGFGG